jgi:hypothetical protein
MKSQLALRERIASSTVVEVAAVNLTFVSGSVQVMISIATTDESQASAVTTALNGKLVDAQAASSFLRVTVESISPIETGQADASQAQSAAAGSGSSMGETIAGILVGVGVFLVGGIAYLIMTRCARKSEKDTPEEVSGAPLSETLSHSGIVPETFTPFSPVQASVNDSSAERPPPTGATSPVSLGRPPAPMGMLAAERLPPPQQIPAQPLPAPAPNVQAKVQSPDTQSPLGAQRLPPPANPTPLGRPPTSGKLLSVPSPPPGRVDSAASQLASSIASLEKRMEAQRQESVQALSSISSSIAKVERNLSATLEVAATTTADADREF